MVVCVCVRHLLNPINEGQAVDRNRPVTTSHGSCAKHRAIVSPGIKLLRGLVPCARPPGPGKFGWRALLEKYRGLQDLREVHMVTHAAPERGQ